MSGTIGAPLTETTGREAVPCSAVPASAIARRPALAMHSRPIDERAGGAMGARTRGVLGRAVARAR